jgi:hypothetical protein
MNADRSLEQIFARLAAVQDALGILRWREARIPPRSSASSAWAR